MSWAALWAALMLLKPVAKTMTAPSSAAPINDTSVADKRRAPGTAMEVMDEVLMGFSLDSG